MDVKSLIERYAPEQDEFEVVLDGGEVFKFRAVRSYGELSAMKEAGAAFVRTLRSDRCHPSLARFRDMDPASVSSAFFLHATCVSPAWTQLDWLEMAASCAWIFELLFGRMNEGQTRARVLAEVDESERLGESSKPTPGGETGSSSPGTSTDATPTNSRKRSKATSSNSSPSR